HQPLCPRGTGLRVGPALRGPDRPGASVELPHVRGRPGRRLRRPRAADGRPAGPARARGLRLLRRCDPVRRHRVHVGAPPAARTGPQPVLAPLPRGRAHDVPEQRVPPHPVRRPGRLRLRALTPDPLPTCAHGPKELHRMGGVNTLGKPNTPGAPVPGGRNPTMAWGHKEERHMGFLGFLLLGLICGAIAKAILPVRQSGGWIATLILGVIGALLGGWIGGAVAGAEMNEFFSLSSWIWAIIGSLIVLVIWGFITKRRTA